MRAWQTRSPSTRTRFRQVIRGINGFKAYYLVKGEDATTSISVFDDRAGAEESNRAAAAWLAASPTSASRRRW